MPGTKPTVSIRGNIAVCRLSNIPKPPQKCPCRQANSPFVSDHFLENNRVFNEFSLHGYPGTCNCAW